MPPVHVHRAPGRLERGAREGETDQGQLGEGNRLAIHDLRRKDEVETPLPRHQDRREMRVLVVTGY